MADIVDGQCGEVLISGLVRIAVRVVLRIAVNTGKTTHSCLCLRLNLRYEHFQLEENELKTRKGKREKDYHCFGPGRREGEE